MPRLLRIVKITNVILLFFLLFLSCAALIESLSFPYNAEGRYFDAVNMVVYEEQSILYFGLSTFILVVALAIAIRWLMKSSLKNKTLNRGITTLLIFSTVLMCSFTQDYYKLVKEIPTQAQDFTTDNLGNIYLINQSEIIKYNRSGDYLSRFSNKLLGKVSYLNADNPMKLIVVYNDQSQLLVLDNMLAETSDKIKLQEMGLEQSNLACNSYNNGIWIYNFLTFSLQRFNSNFVLSNKAENLNQLLSADIKPNYMSEYNNFVYLNDPLIGLLVFDNFGNYYKTIPITGLQSYQFIDNNLVYQKQGSLHYFDLKTLEDKPIAIPDTSAIKVRLQERTFYSLTKDKLLLHYTQ